MTSNSNEIKSRSQILKIPLYSGGESKVANFENPIKLSSNENPLGPSKDAIDAFIKIKDSLAAYPDSSHIRLRSAISDIHGIDVDRIICGAGSDEIIQFLCQCYAGIGDEVIHTRHGFLMYKISAIAAGARPVSVPEVKRRADVTRILKACNEKTKLIFLANPNNPTGTFLSHHEIVQLLDSIPKHALLVLDGAYAEYIEDFDGGLSLSEGRKNIFILRTFSKIYGLAALRIGWGYGPRHVIDTLNRVRGPFNLSSAAQETAIAAIKDIEYVKTCRVLNSKNRNKLAIGLKKLGIESDLSAANFVLARFSSIQEAAFVNQHLREQGIIVRDTKNYGLGSALRISVGTSSDCEKVLSSLVNFMG